MQKDMVPILTSEGYTVTGRELMRIRAKHKWFLRRPNGTAMTLPEEQAESGGQDDQIDQNELSEIAQANQLADDQMQMANQQLHEQQMGPFTPQPQELVAENGELLHACVPTSELTRRTDGMLDRRERYRRRKMMDSDPKWQARKRRRPQGDNNGAGAQADIRGPPRYPSETTLGEVRTLLQLDKQMYWDVRSQFEEICRQRGILRKTTCGPEAWQAAKDFLIQTNPHLNQVFSTPDQSLLQRIRLSLDVACMDVTKHIRNSGKAFTLADAKNILGINPDQARELRDSLMAILAANGFVNTFESDNLGELKEQWLEQTGLRNQIPTEEGPDKERVVRAINLLCREIMKRWREEQAKNDPTKAKRPRPNNDGSAVPRNRKSTAPPGQAIMAVAPTASASNDPQIDPSLLLAASNHSLLDEALPLPAPYPLPDASANPIPAYFRLNAMSTAQGAPTLWLGALAQPTVQSLHAAALSCRGGHPSQIGRIEGVVGSPAAPDMMIQIDHDDELQAYLSHVGAGKATFVVLMH